MYIIKNILFIWACAILVIAFTVGLGWSMVWLVEMSKAYAVLVVLSFVITLIGLATATSPYNSPYASFVEWLKSE